MFERIASFDSFSILPSMEYENFLVLSVQTTIPMIMGANIGTTITSTLVAFVQVNKRAEFQLAMEGATVHDMFNWLCVCILLPVEVVTELIATGIAPNASVNWLYEINY